MGWFDFTNYDDPYYIFENPVVRYGLSLRGMGWALITHVYDFWHPLTWMSHMLDCELFGHRPGLHHLANVAFHVANVLLLFTVLRRLTGAVARSAVVRPCSHCIRSTWNRWPGWPSARMC